MKTTYLFSALTTVIMVTTTVTGFTQRTGTSTTKGNLTVTDKMFVQDAINRNNEAMALAQAAMQQSQKKDVQQIARQLMTDHRAAQKKLYAIAGISDTVPYSRSVIQPVAGHNKLPTTDNLDSRRNRTVVSITNEHTPANTSASNANTTNNNAAGNTVAGTAITQRQTGFDTTSRFGVNQTFNGNTAIDNANGINNSNRTDMASSSGRASELNTPAYTQNPVTGQQQLNNGINSNNTATSVPANNNSNTTDFPIRVTDTIRQTGSTAGFQNPGTNLSFPGNERYSKTTPAVAPNNNAGSDYGVTGVPVNNAQTNALNTAPYSNNDINSNSVQTGRMLPTSNPAAVINSSTASMGNKDVGYNNANTGNNGAVQQNGQMAADNANGINRRTSEVINSNTLSSTNMSNATGNDTTATRTVTNNGAVLAGRTRNNNNSANGTNMQPADATTNATNAGSFYTEPFAASPSLNTLRTTPSDAFDAQWAIQMNANQQAAVTLYQSVLRRVTNVQVKAYINTVLPLLRGHQFALKQWQSSQK